MVLGGGEQEVTCKLNVNEPGIRLAAVLSFIPSLLYLEADGEVLEQFRWPKRGQAWYILNLRYTTLLQGLSAWSSLRRMGDRCIHVLIVISVSFWVLCKPSD